MKFEASIELNRLHDALEAVGVVVDEARFTISKDGITSYMRDAGNAIEVLLKIKKEAFQSWIYDGAQQEIALVGLNALVNKLAELQKIKNEEEGDFAFDEGIKLSIDKSVNQLLLSRGNFTYRKYLTDPAGIRETPEIQFTLPVEVRVEGAKLVNALCLVEQEAQAPYFDIKDGQLIISSGITKEDGDPTTECKIQPLNVASAEVHSVFSMDYLSDLKKPLSKADVVMLYMATDSPIRMRYSLHYGSIEIVYTLAPRAGAWMEQLSISELACELDNINVRLGRKGELHGFEEAVLKQASRSFRETDNDTVVCLECEYPISIQNPTPGEHVVCPNCESEHEVKLTICLATLSKKARKGGK